MQSLIHGPTQHCEDVIFTTRRHYLQRADLVSEYQVEISPIRAAFKMLTALPFVPENLITTAWRQLRPTLPHGNFYRLLQEDLGWYHTRLSALSHSRWSQNDATALLLPWSSNIADGWHHGFNAIMSCSNPSIWKFLQCLKNEQNIADVKMTKLMMRESPEPRSAKWMKYDEKLQTIIQTFDSYPIILDFLKCTSCLM